MALDFVAGCFGGCAGVVIGHPLDTIKVHLQTQTGNRLFDGGALDCFKSLLAKEGIRGLYKGMTSPLMGVAAVNAIVFGVYGNTQRSIGNSNSLATHFTAGASAGFFQSFICSPIELAKLKMQISINLYKSPLQCLQQIYSKEGYRGVFRGLGITVVREVPAFGSYFLTYEYLTRRQEPISTMTMMLAGGFAGIISWVIVYPVDVIKTRIQVNNHHFINWLDCLKRSILNEGYTFLYKGIGPTILRAFPVNAATFTVVTWTMRLMDEVKESNEVVRDGEILWEKCADAITLKLSDFAIF